MDKHFNCPHCNKEIFFYTEGPSQAEQVIIDSIKHIRSEQEKQHWWIPGRKVFTKNESPTWEEINKRIVWRG